MHEIFTQPEFQFPYAGHRFPGQNSDEEILFIVRENDVMHYARLSMVFGMGLALLVAGWLFGAFLQNNLGLAVPMGFGFLTVIAAAAVVIIGTWWQTQLWLRSICIVTTKRLTKFVYTTPFNRHALSLPLDMIVDTGSYTKGFLQALFKLGTFTARSSAASSGVATDDEERVNKKYFYIENVAIAEDLQQYVNKLLSVFRSRHGELSGFRPFIPQGYGKRDRLIAEYPKFWS